MTPRRPDRAPPETTVLMTDGTLAPDAIVPAGTPDLADLLNASINAKDARTMTNPLPPNPADPNAPVMPAQPPRTPAPGVGATIYGNLPGDISADVVEACDFVTLHTAADRTDVTSAAKVRALGCDRVWLALPANYFVRLAASKGVAAAVAESKRCAGIARDMGAEVFEFNGEGEGTGQTPGDWIPADPAEAAKLVELAAAIIDAARDTLSGTACILSWTSHDMPSFKLPWPSILSRVDVHSPQHYPADSKHTVKQAELTARIARSAGRWSALVDHGAVKAAMTPGGDRWVPYLQGWGHTLGAQVWGLCEAPVARLWAYPGSWSPEGLKALHAARALRAAAGFGPDAVERFQAQRGLDVDGVVGAKTIDALRGSTPYAL